MKWKVDGKKIQIKQEKRFRQRNGKSSLLRIKFVQNNDSGMYECVASNDYGIVSRKLNLTVVGKLAMKLFLFYFELLPTRYTTTKYLAPFLLA